MEAGQVQVFVTRWDRQKGQSCIQYTEDQEAWEAIYVCSNLCIDANFDLGRLESQFAQNNYVARNQKERKTYIVMGLYDRKFLSCVKVYGKKILQSLHSNNYAIVMFRCSKQ